YSLMAADAEIHGSTAQYENGGGKDNIGYWIDAKDYVTWNVSPSRAGRYRVEVIYACQPDNAGSDFVVAAGSTSVSGRVKATGSWMAFKSESLDAMSL